jgi:hypothetical protein
MQCDYNDEKKIKKWFKKYFVLFEVERAVIIYCDVWQNKPFVCGKIQSNLNAEFPNTIEYPSKKRFNRRNETNIFATIYYNLNL